MKRFFDIAVSVFLLVILTPLLILLALLVRTKLGRPVLFRQTRPGKDAKPFTMLKFRTMTDECGPDGRLLPDRERLTPFGRFLRSSSLDELPALWCVLKGNMSLVGPRPLAMSYLTLYSPEQARRHEVKPGITGWAQVNGRNLITWRQKFSYDVWYVDNQDLWLDMKILFMTVKVVLLGAGVAAGGQSDVESFDGTN